MDVVPQVPVEMEAAEAPEELSDAWITLKVKGALAVHREVSALSTEVVTDHGVVILAGSAVSQHERQVATSVAEGIKGVKRVDNRMQVYNERP
jgi:hyperosmotically inducible protein